MTLRVLIKTEVIPRNFHNASYEYSGDYLIITHLVTTEETVRNYRTTIFNLAYVSALDFSQPIIKPI